MNIYVYFTVHLSGDETWNSVDKVSINFKLNSLLTGISNQVLRVCVIEIKAACNHKFP